MGLNLFCLALFFVCLFVCLFFETGFFCVITLAVLELVLVDQAGLALTKVHLPLPPSAGIKGVLYHYPAGFKS